MLRTLVVALTLIGATASAQTVTTADPARFEPEITKFDDADRVTPVAAGGVVFTGSSSIRLWTTMSEDFPGIATLNRGFGGSDIPDAIRYVDRVVLRYQPGKVVFYSGDNDLNGGRTPTEVAADYKRFIDAVQAKLPAARIIILAIKPSLARWALVDKARETNRLVQELVASDPAHLAYVDVFTPMLGADGKPRAELYVADGLHMTPAGYAIWKQALAPLLR